MASIANSRWCEWTSGCSSAYLTSAFMHAYPMSHHDEHFKHNWLFHKWTMSGQDNILEWFPTRFLGRLLFVWSILTNIAGACRNDFHNQLFVFVFTSRFEHHGSHGRYPLSVNYTAHPARRGETCASCWPLSPEDVPSVVLFSAKIVSRCVGWWCWPFNVVMVLR